MKTRKTSLLILIAAALGSLGLAQSTSSSGSNTSTSTSTTTTTGTTAPTAVSRSNTLNAPTAVSQGTTLNAATAAANSPGPTAPTTTAQPQTGVNSTGNVNSTPGTTTMGTDVTTSTSTGQVIDPAATALTPNVSRIASGTLNTPTMTSEILSVNLGTRDQIATQAQVRIDAANQALNDLRMRGMTLPGSQSTQFQTSVALAQQQEARVRADLRSLQSATSETDLQQSRDALARDYQAYATAVAQVENLSTPQSVP